MAEVTRGDKPIAPLLFYKKINPKPDKPHGGDIKILENIRRIVQLALKLEGVRDMQPCTDLRTDVHKRVADDNPDHRFLEIHLVLIGCAGNEAADKDNNIVIIVIIALKLIEFMNSVKGKIAVTMARSSAFFSLSRPLRSMPVITYSKKGSALCSFSALSNIDGRYTIN